MDKTQLSIENVCGSVISQLNTKFEKKIDKLEIESTKTNK